MTIVYKLTTQDNKTRKGQENECVWGPNVTHRGTGQGELCGPGYIHAYTSPLLAVLFNCLHANFFHPKLWEARTEIVKNDRGVKVGGVSLTTIREIPLPTISAKQKVMFAFLCLKTLNVSQEYTLQVERGIEALQCENYAAARAAAWTAADAARAAADAADAARAAAWTAAYAAAWTAADAARAAADAAYAAYAADAVDAAVYAARAAADAVWTAAYAGNILDLNAIAEEACK